MGPEALWSFKFIGNNEIIIKVHIKRFNDDAPGIYKDEFEPTAAG